MKIAVYNVTMWLIALALLLAQPFGNAQDDDDFEDELPDINPVQMQLLRQAPGNFRPGTMMDINVTILVSQPNPQLTALGLRETLPEGWVFAALRGVNGQPPAVQPQPGAMGMLEFAWITPPTQFPYTIAYTVEVPPEAGGKQFFSGQLVYRQFEGELLTAPVITLVTGPDNKPPTVTLQGENPMIIERGTPFVEPGYNATDETDGNVTASVQVSGVVNSQVPGTYTLSYTATDRAGNRSAPVTREVQVVAPDNTPGPVAGNPGNSGGSNTNRPRNLPRQRFVGNVPRTTARGGETQEQALNPGGPRADQDLNPNDFDAQGTDHSARMDEARARQAENASRAAEQQALIEARRQEALQRASQVTTTIRLPRDGGADSAGPLSAVAERITEQMKNAEKSASDDASADTSTAALVAEATPPAPVTSGDAPETSQKAEDQAFEETQNIQLAQADSLTPAASVAATKPPAAPGALERMATSLANLDSRAIMRLMGVLLVGVAVLVFAYLAYRGAYRSTPRRRSAGKREENPGSDQEAQHQA